MQTIHAAYDWLRAHWPVIGPALAVVAYLTAEALLKMSSRFKANSPVEAIANILVKVLPKWIPIVSKVAAMLATPETVASAPPVTVAPVVAKIGPALLLVLVLGASGCSGRSVDAALVVGTVAPFMLIGFRGPLLRLVRAIGWGWRDGSVSVVLLLFAVPAHAQVAPNVASDMIAPSAPPRDPGVLAPATPQPGTLTISHPPPAFEHSKDPLDAVLAVAPAPAPQPPPCKCDLLHDRTFYTTIFSALGTSLSVPILSWLAVHFTEPQTNAAMAQAMGMP